jgi:hypothetical protein
LSDVLYALEIWMLVSLLVGWILARAALRLREPPRAEPQQTQSTAEPPAQFRPDPVIRVSLASVVRLFDDELDAVPTRGPRSVTRVER